MSDEVLKRSRVISDLSRLQDRLSLGSADLEAYAATKDRFSFAVTEHLSELIEAADCAGLRKQFIPDQAELAVRPSEFADVASEKESTPTPGIVHRYPGKVLLLLTLDCPAYCRFCYRKVRRADEGSSRLSSSQIDAALEYIARNDISEVIFSGGDPFHLSDKMLGDVCAKLSKVDCVKIVRFHTRFLTFDPKRITASLLQQIRIRKATYLVGHVNQVEEIGQDFEDAVDRLIDAGIPVLSQTALLRGVNDNEDALRRLFTKLVHIRVKPYYLFHTDPTEGLAHFRVKLSRGIELYRSIFDRISGLGMPIYLMNVPGGYGHTAIDLGNTRDLGGGMYEIETWDGRRVVFNDN